MTDFPRTLVGGVSMPRLLVGTNWFLGYSHTSRAQDKFIPASPAMTSAQAPAALTTTGAVKLPARVSAVHRPSARAKRVTSAPVTSVPPRAL